MKKSNESLKKGMTLHTLLLKRWRTTKLPSTHTKTLSVYSHYRSTITQIYCRFSSLLTLCSHCSTNWVSFQNVPTAFQVDGSITKIDNQRPNYSAIPSQVTSVYGLWPKENHNISHKFTYNNIFTMNCLLKAFNDL